MNDLNFLDRYEPLTLPDLAASFDELNERIDCASILVVGGAGSIGKSVVKAMLEFSITRIDIVDINENGLAELVRDLRSSSGLKGTELKTFCLDVGSPIFKKFLESQEAYDYVFNLSAMKHVRSERDRFTLSRMIETNIYNSMILAEYCRSVGAKKYFCVSTDKAANPTNFMGATKKLMEMFLIQQSRHQNVSFSRFANVLFSDGSLPHGFTQRFERKQPLSAPRDIKRYFVTREEAGHLCLLSALLGNNREILFPKLSGPEHEISFADLAEKFLRSKGYRPVLCESEDEARTSAGTLIQEGKWPCFFFNSDTSGEKELEEFYTLNEKVDFDRFTGLGVIEQALFGKSASFSDFRRDVERWQVDPNSGMSDISEVFRRFVPEFQHKERGRNLDQRM